MMSKLKDPQRYGQIEQIVFKTAIRKITRYLMQSRFASFIEGSSHLEDAEVLEYETSQYGLGYISDDESDDSETDNFGDDLNNGAHLHTSGRRLPGLTDRNSMTRTSTPTNPKANGTILRPIYRGYNGTVELSDDEQ